MRFRFSAFAGLCLTLSASPTLACEELGKGLRQSLPSAALADWYGASMGSRLMPESWYRALTRADDGSPFAARTNLQRYGFRYCDDDAAKLAMDPIGFVIDGDQTRPPAIGMTCAACHTGHLTDGKHAFLVQGGQGAMDFQSFTQDLFVAVLKTRSGPFKDAAQTEDWQVFATAVLGKGYAPEAAEALHNDLSAWLQNRKDIQASIHQGGNWGFGRQDAVQVILNTVAALSDAKLMGGLPAATGPVSIPHVWLSARASLGDPAERAMDIGLSGPVGTEAMLRDIAKVIGVFGEVALPGNKELEGKSYLQVKSSVRLANLIRLEQAMAQIAPPLWPQEWGVLDTRSPDWAAGKALYDAHCAACHSRVDRARPGQQIGNATGLPLGPAPLGEGVPFVRMVDAFAVPGQAGPVVGPMAGTDPMRLCNAMTHSAWGGKLGAFTNVFAALRDYVASGPTDLKVTRFAPGTETSRLVEDLALRILWDKQSELAGVTSSNRAKAAAAATKSFFAWFTGNDLPVEGGDWRLEPAGKVPSTPLLADLSEVRAVCAATLAQRAADSPAVPRGYLAGPLAGIFASAPFLHNGSVPTLDALLLPPDQRPTTFAVGAVLFDPVKVGLGAALPEGPSGTFAVITGNGRVIAGNSNAGHAYPPVPLTAVERAQLILYLKSL